MTYITRLILNESMFGSRTMAMTLVVLGILAMQSRPVNGQWTTNGNNINNTNTGNVGIGTTSPTAKLHVSGSGSVTGKIEGSAASELDLISNTSGSGSWAISTGWASSGSIRNYYLYDNVAGATRFLINSSGNVGIGTTTPSASYKLDVNGGITIWLALPRRSASRTTE